MQVTKNQSYVGALFSLLCCCLPRSVQKLGGIEDERALTKKEEEKEKSGHSALWTVSHASKVSSAVGGVNRAFLNFFIWLLVTIGLVFSFITQFEWFPTSKIEYTDGQPLTTCVAYLRCCIYSVALQCLVLLLRCCKQAARNFTYAPALGHLAPESKESQQIILATHFRERCPAKAAYIA